MRIVVALGGNAMTAADGSATEQAQQAAIAEAMTHVAGLIADGHELVLTHGNGPQVGNLLVKNELAAHVVPPVSLDWCGAQTQGTLGFTIVSALESALARRGLTRPVAAVVTRTLVDGADPGFVEPTKPIGRYLPRAQAQPLIDHGQVWHAFGDKGFRRVVASPEPLAILDVPAVRVLLDAGYVVCAAGGGGIPMVRDESGLHGVEAVIDKDLTAALLAGELDADALVIATDVAHAAIDWGTARQRDLGEISVSELRAHAVAGQFGSGSMGPKVEAALRFVEGRGPTSPPVEPASPPGERAGPFSVITSLANIGAALTGSVGTVIRPNPVPFCDQPIERTSRARRH